eukprot:scaffold82078_cov66-Phaeocystis_antarctica.AAC.3
MLCRQYVEPFCWRHLAHSREGWISHSGRHSRVSAASLRRVRDAMSEARSAICWCCQICPSFSVVKARSSSCSRVVARSDAFIALALATGALSPQGAWSCASAEQSPKAKEHHDPTNFPLRE